MPSNKKNLKFYLKTSYPIVVWNSKWKQTKSSNPDLQHCLAHMYCKTRNEAHVHVPEDGEYADEEGGHHEDAGHVRGDSQILRKENL